MTLVDGENRSDSSVFDYNVVKAKLSTGDSALCDAKNVVDRHHPVVNVCANENCQVVRDICVDDRAFNTNLGQRIFSLDVLTGQELAAPKIDEIDEMDDTEALFPVAVKEIVENPDFYHCNRDNPADLKGSCIVEDEDDNTSSKNMDFHPKTLPSLGDLLSIPQDVEEGSADLPDEILPLLSHESDIVNAEGIQYHGETSFTASGSMPGLITYSGPVAHAGSLSLRSDSSTTSARSFAFPILQSEWNWSPERMAKAERRHQRMLRRWKHRILCCKF